MKTQILFFWALAVVSSIGKGSENSRATANIGGSCTIDPGLLLDLQAELTSRINSEEHVSSLVPATSEPINVRRVLDQFAISAKRELTDAFSVEPGNRRSFNYNISSSKSTGNWVEERIRNSDNSRLVIIGDLHGDFGNAYKALIDGGLINCNGTWIPSGENEFKALIQMGDVMDGGPDGAFITLFLERLREQALSYGDAVIKIIGNHEFFALSGHHAGDPTISYGSKANQSKVWSVENPHGLPQLLLKTAHVGVIIADMVFVHGGLPPVEQATVVDFDVTKLDVFDLLKSGNAYQIISKTNDELSVWWDRTTAQKGSCFALRAKLNALQHGLKYVLVGHTPQKQIVHLCSKSSYNAVAWLTDTLISSYKSQKIKSHDASLLVSEIHRDGDGMYNRKWATVTFPRQATDHLILTMSQPQTQYVYTDRWSPRICPSC